MQADFNRPVLAVDTGTSYLSLALRADGEIRLFHQEVGIRQSELILPEIRTLFRNAGITAADLGAIVYAKGPGAFTGLRIGIGVAQGLATPFDTPLIGIPTLDATASLPPPQSCILAAADARMGEVFYAWFDTLNRRRLSDYQVGRAADIALPEGTSFQTASAVRSHWKTVRPSQANPICRPPPIFSRSPSAAAIPQLARHTPNCSTSATKSP